MNLKNIEDIYELSPLQQGMLFHTLLVPNSGVYFEQFCYALQTQLDVPAFNKAWQRVLDRHPILRTSFYWENLDKPYQVVYRQVDLPWDFQDWRQLSLEETEKQLEVFLAADRKRGFTLSQVPLIRLALIQVADNAYQFVFSYHHILMEGWSLTWLWKEFYEFYNAFCKGQDLHLEYPRPFREYISWLQQQDISKAEIYWREKLRGFTVPTPLIIDKATDIFSSENEDHDCQQTLLSVTTTDALNSLTRKYHLTLNILLKGAWAILLSRYSGESDIVFGATSSGRPIELAEAESMMGLFANTLPLRVEVDSNALLIPWLKKLQVQEVEMRQYEYSPLIQIQQWSQISRGLPLFESLLSFNNYLVDDTKEKLAQSMVMSEARIFEKTNYPLTLQVYPDSDLLLSIGYDTRRFDSVTINRILGHLKTLLESMVANPEQQLRELSLLTAQEKYQLLLEWNDTEVEYPQKQCIHQLFEAQVERTPDAVAVVLESEQLTYQELNTKANQLAHYLRSLGVKSEVLVGICVERSLCMVIGLLAILKAGGAYIPLDPSYPQERLAYMLEDSQPSVLITQKYLLKNLPNHKAQVLCISSDWEKIANESTENPISIITPDNLAYVIYTSGSTGKPKGAMNAHSGIRNRLLWMQQTYQLTSADIVLQKTPFSFDVSVWEFFWTLITGARLVVAQPEGHKDTNYLVNLIAQQQITTLHFVPSMLQVFIEAEGLEKCQSLIRIIASGEALPAQLQQRFFNKLDAQLHNLYGPTEAAVDVTFWQCEKEGVTNQNTVSIGQPIANIQIYLLDKYLNPVPVGVTGEIYIGGVGVGRGYLNRPDLTAEKFIPNPFIQQTERLYKTGDKARYLANGEIEYIGRIDNQVKVRGFRIELGEIEAIISQYPAVRETVVVVSKELADSQRIVAYVVPQKEQILAIPELRGFLEAKLPSYMIPAIFVTLEALPLTPNGKVDRKALRTPELTQISSSNIIPPSTPIENLLAGIWAEILGIDKVSINSNFFELGGHSLIATRVISQIRQVFKAELPLRYLFEKPTIAGLATEIEKAIKIDSAVEVTNIEQIERTEELPLSFAQQRQWFLAQLEPDNPFYNIPAAVRLQGQLNLEALEQSFNEIVSRHEALRTNFQTREGQAVAVISQEKPLTLSILDISSLPANQHQAEIKQQAAQEAQQPFDISSDHLLRVKLLRLSEQEHVVLLTMHHIASDGWSIGVLVRELATLYQSFCNGQPSPLTELPIQYVDFTAWQRQWLQGEVLQSQISYWQKQLEDAPRVLELPTDYPRPAIQTFRGATYLFKLSKQLSAALNKLSQQQGSTLFMTLLAGFQTLLWRYIGQEDIVIGSPIANRNRAEIEGLIGFFVNTLVLRTNLAGNPSFEELLKRVREVALGAYAHQDLPFELLVEELQPLRDLSHTPLFQVMFVLQNAPMSALELPDLTLTPLESHSGTAQFDLTLYMTETESGLVGSFEYNTDLFAQSSIQRMVGHLQTLLEAIVTNPQQPLSDLPLLTEFEQHQLLREWNDTKVEYPQQQCIHQLFETQVEQTPDAIAVVFEDEQLTYCELNARANQLAHYLRTLGVKPEVLVGICVERSLSMVIALLAILKAGGVYVPLDPSYPQERLAFILEDTQAAVLLTTASLLETIPQHKAKVVCLDTDWQEIAQQSQENLFSQITTDNLAYVIYTSGSTGRPKGVMIKHASTVAMLDWANKTFAIGAMQGVLASTSICFDLSVFEVFVPLSCGGKVILIENALLLPTLPASFGVTLINTVPSLISQLVRTNSIPTSVQTVNIAGEPLHNQLVQQLYKQDNIQQVFNLYGPSEDTTYSTSSWIHKGATNTPSIGRPIHNTQTYLLDENLQPVPIGVPGMLYIGGAGLARGYLNKAEFTADKFIPNPYAKQPGERLYKTGDKARYLPNGEIEYIGRIDNQVKVRGFRIELGEIEALIIQHTAVQEAVVAVHSSEIDSQQIVAYVVPTREQTLTISELRNFLEAKLPPYMIPAAFVILETLPLTPNGKVDRKALKVPDTAKSENKELVAPRNSLETKLTKIWAEVLGVEQVGIFDNFFELGGDSIFAILVITKANQAGLKLTVKQLFQHQTVASLATVAVTKKVNQVEQQIIKEDTLSNFPKANLNQQDLTRFLAKINPENKNKTT